MSWTSSPTHLIKVFKGENRVMVDLGIERVIGIEKDSTKIAVEIKSFIAASTIHAYYEALGQYILAQFGFQVVIHSLNYSQGFKTLKIS